MNKITIKEFATKEEMTLVYPLIHQIREEMDFETYSEALEEMIKRNAFKMIVAFDDKKIVGAGGYWISRMLYCGRYIQLSNFVVDCNERQKGIGQKILDEIAKIAQNEGCKKIVLDSYVENKKSHSLFFRQGFYIRGLHFMKDL